MTGHDDFDRTLAGWFEADALSPAPAGGLDRVLDATRRRRPRPAWLAGPGSRWVGETDTSGSRNGGRSLRRQGLRWSIALIVLLAIAALVGGALLVGARVFQPSPMPTDSPTPSEGLTDCSSPTAPLPLPTGRLGHLAYGLDGDIFVADWDGRNPVRVADGLPSVSPVDGQGFLGRGIDVVARRAASRLSAWRGP